MKNNLKIMIVSILLTLPLYSAPSKANSNIEYITILENNIERKLRNYTAKELESQAGVIVSFKDSKKTNLESFEKKYSLNLKTKLVIGYYIFLNQSLKTDVEIVKDIMENETNIKTVKPNWKMKNRTY